MQHLVFGAGHSATEDRVRLRRRLAALLNQSPENRVVQIVNVCFRYLLGAMRSSPGFLFVTDRRRSGRQMTVDTRVVYLEDISTS